MKYIIFEDFSGAPIPVIFPGRINHADMREQMPYTRVLSAGYVQTRDKEFVCHGGSKGLNAQARPEDAEIIARRFENPDA
jgi:hypothetical protein